MSRAPKTLVLIRGLVRETRHWADFPKQLEGLGFNVVTIDLPGVGAFSKKFPPTSVFATMEFVRAEVMKKSEGPFGLFGVSLGGMVALQWTQNHSKEISGCMVLNTSSKLSPPGKRLRWQVWGEFLKFRFMSDIKKREESVTQLVINHPEQQKKASESWGAIARDFKVHPLAFSNQLIAASQFLPSDQCKGSDKIMVISSDGDRMVDPSCGKVLADKYNWQFKEHSWGGHDLVWDDQEWCLNQIQSFFA